MIDFKQLNRPVDVDAIDFRVQSINKGKYATILAYKDARYDMNVLDEVVGPENWQKDYKLIDGKLFCGIGIFVPDEMGGRWVWKWDVGSESDVEKEKGQASDAAKRAGFAWGIGRELYDFPVISVKLLDHECEEYNGKFRQTFGLKLKEWQWAIQRDANNKITSLTATDENGKLRFNYSASNKATKKPSEPSSPTPAPTPQSAQQSPSNGNQKASDEQMGALRKFLGKMPTSVEKQELIETLNKGVTAAAADKLIELFGQGNDAVVADMKAKKERK